MTCIYFAVNEAAPYPPPTPPPGPIRQYLKNRNHCNTRLSKKNFQIVKDVFTYKWSMGSLRLKVSQKICVGKNSFKTGNCKKEISEITQ